MNQIALIGRLGQDPQTRHTGSGKAVANFNLAVDDGFGERKKTYWIPIVCWEKTAELAQQYLVKGSQVAVVGKLSQRSYEDKDGNNRTVFEVVAAQLDFLTKAEKRSQSEQSFDAPQVADEDIPF